VLLLEVTCPQAPSALPLDRQVFYCYFQLISLFELLPKAAVSPFLQGMGGIAARHLVVCYLLFDFLCIQLEFSSPCKT